MTVLALVLAPLISPAAEEIDLREGLGVTIPPARRSVIHIDPVEAKIVEGGWTPPHEGEAAGTAKWSKIVANEEGWFQGGPARGGYVYTSLDLREAKTMLLEAVGHTMAYVNGAPRAGDPYMYGYVSLPVDLRKGRNDLLFLCGRGRLKVRLVEPPKPVSFDLRDPTLPDIREEKKEPMWGALVIRNATAKALTGLKVIAGSQTSQIGPIAPMTIRKIGFKLEPLPKQTVRLVQGTTELDRAEVELRVRKAHETYKRTFLSGIDGSVQYYAVNPASTPSPGKALVLSLHGASVEAIGQADAYSSKSWAHIVCPTNRRPFGFDWEDIGRLDAIEVLEHAQKELQTDARRVYLTGHSMGGHGTWNLGAHFPDRFAAIGPSAGWISFWTYAGGAQYNSEDSIEAMLLRASANSDTLALKRNFAYQGIYILHGDADDNVPVSQARTMREELEEFHRNFDWHEQKGAGHWWDASDEPGADCVDWAPMFDMFARHRLPDPNEVRQVDFTTVNPHVSGKCHWLTILEQIEPLKPSTVSLRWDPHLGRVVGTTSNVLRMQLSLPSLKSIQLDGSSVTPVGANPLMRKGIVWEAVLPTPRTGVKRYQADYSFAGFKGIFQNRFQFAYGTRGSPVENEWAFNKARYDAETYWYRGNGSADLVPDTGLLRMEGGVVCYGNAQTHAQLDTGPLEDSRVQLERGSAKLGDRQVTGEDVACLSIFPSMGGRQLAQIGGTGLRGMRLTDRVPIFSSGVGIPDVLLMRPTVLEKGSAGVVAAGFYSRVRGEEAQMAWRE